MRAARRRSTFENLRSIWRPRARREADPDGPAALRLEWIEKQQPVYVVCASGGRSAAMTDFLRNPGFDAYSVAGGTSGWARSGRTIIEGRERG